MENKYFKNQIFASFVERLSTDVVTFKKTTPEEIISSINELMTKIVDASNIYYNTFKVPDYDKLVFAEDVPGDTINNINNVGSISAITPDTLRDIRVVTYTADEKPATISKRRLGEDGVQSIKWRLIDVYEDPEYTGYSILRFGKEIEADISFHVWGTNYQDIRKRSSLLKDIIDSNAWFLKHKGLRDIIWRESTETRLWDGKNIVKEKIEHYLVRFMEIKIMREKNLEQIALEFGLEERT
jgi:hypothetical protein